MASSDFVAFVLEQMHGPDGVQAKRMFGGHGIFRDGLMFAIVIADRLYFKADDEDVATFTQRGLKPFSYDMKGRTMSLRYYEAPPEVFDAPEAMRQWGDAAFACALRNRKPPGKARGVQRR